MHNQYSRQRYLRHIMTLAGACITTGLAAQTSPTDVPAAGTTGDEDIFVLSPFEVTSSRDTGYIATETLAGTRIRTDLKDVASAISVVTKEFMNDVGATDNSSLLQYTVGADVAGTRGTYSGQSMTAQTSYDGTPISSNQRVRGLSSADTTRDYFLSSVPWDSYNIDRIDIQRGPNSLLFGLGSPSGIINAGTHSPQYTDSGSVEARYGSYGSTRGAIDLNKTLIDNVLAIRVDGLWSDTKYQQKPAYKDDHRIFVAGRWDPKIFGPNFETSIKVKAEKGKIDANMPRQNPPYDSITPWFDPTSDAYKLTVGAAGSGTSVYDLSTNASLKNSYYSSAIGEKQQVAYLIDGATGTSLGANAGYINGGYLNNDGTSRGYSSGAIGLIDNWMMYTLNGYANYAYNEKMPHYATGQYKNMMLSDSSVFDFYNKLIDGDNKGETADWTAYNIDFSQRGWGDRVGLNLTYNYEKYNANDWSVIGSAPTINIDITKVGQDGKTNPNYGRAFISNVSGGSGTWSTTKYSTFRASAFAELRASDVLDNQFLVKLLGHQRFNVTASRDTYFKESRGYNLYSASNAWNTYVTGDSNASWNYRSPVAIIYLDNSLAGRNSASGLDLSSITGDITMEDTNVYLFDSTWKNYNVSPSASWTPSTAYLQNAYSGAATQASNPDNYVGWSSERVLTLLSKNDGDNLYTSGSKTERVISSYAASWQGFFWNDAVVPTFGWRYDSVKTRSINATVDSSNHSYYRFDNANYSLPDWDSTKINYYKSHSISGGVVMHINKLLPESWDRYVPLNLSLSYNDSSNFQVTSARVDVWGNPISNPKGSTKEFGVQLSTKDDRFSFRAIKYTTRVKDATVSTDTSFTGTISQGLKFRNVFLYQLSNYPWSSRVKANASGDKYTNYNGESVICNTRWYWTPSYVDSNGRPVASIYYATEYGLPAPTGYDHLETWAQSNAHRDACIDSWNDIQKWLTDKGFMSVWNCTATSVDALCTRSEYEAGATVGADGILSNPTYDSKLDTSTVGYCYTTTPSGFAITADQESKGWEFELTANITKNWRLAFNASKTTAMYVNVGGSAMQELYDYLNPLINGIAGDMRQWDGDFKDGQEVRDNWATGFHKTWALLKLQEGLASSELRKWKFNVITSYDFDSGWLKDFGVGAAYRWQDKVGIGYPILSDSEGNDVYDLANPIMGPSESGTDLWVSYKHKLTDKIDWKIQLNVSNAFENDGLIPISVEPDGTTWAGFRIKPVMEWTLTNTFTF
jgi:outer membrane receptor protein involved in Fe transport